MKLLLDENLSPWVAQVLRREDLLDVTCVRDRGKVGASDPDVLDLAFAEDRILVTANVGDFRRLARAREVHPGIVLLEEGDLGRADQLARIRSAIARIREEPDVVNKLVTLWPDGTITIETVPAE